MILYGLGRWLLNGFVVIWVFLGWWGRACRSIIDCRAIEIKGAGRDRGRRGGGSIDEAGGAFFGSIGTDGYG